MARRFTKSRRRLRTRRLDGALLAMGLMVCVAWPLSYLWYFGANLRRIGGFASGGHLLVFVPHGAPRVGHFDGVTYGPIDKSGPDLPAFLFDQFTVGRVMTPNTVTWNETWIRFPLWLPVLLLLVWPVIDWLVPRRTNPGVCAGCGYDLRGIDPEAPCPECGRPRDPVDKPTADDADSTDPPARRSSGSVAVGVFCGFLGLAVWIFLTSGEGHGGPEPIVGWGVFDRWAMDHPAMFLIAPALCFLVPAVFGWGAMCYRTRPRP